MTADTIELVTPRPGEKRWRIKINGGPKFATSIELDETTQRVVEILRKTYKPKVIRSPAGAMIYPRPPGGWPHLIGQRR